MNIKYKRVRVLISHFAAQGVHNFTFFSSCRWKNSKNVNMCPAHSDQRFVWFLSRVKWLSNKWGQRHLKTRTGCTRLNLLLWEGHSRSLVSTGFTTSETSSNGCLGPSSCWNILLCPGFNGSWLFEVKSEGVFTPALSVHFNQIVVHLPRKSSSLGLVWTRN